MKETNKLKALAYEWTLLMANFWGARILSGFADKKNIYSRNKFMDWEVHLQKDCPTERN